MAVVDALRQTPAALRRSPTLAVPVSLALAAPMLLVGFGTGSVETGVLRVGLVAVAAAVVPFVHGGVLAMADEALDGRASLRTFLVGGASNYPSLAAVSLVVAGVSLAFAVAGAFLSIVGNFAVYGDVAGDVDYVALAIVAGVFAVGGTAYLLVVLFVQFYGQAVVVEGRGPVGAVRRSLGVVGTHLASTAVYSAFVGALVGGFASLVWVVVSPTATGVGLGRIGTTLWVVVAGGAVTSFVAVYSVAFYRTLVADVPVSADGSDAGG